MTHNDFTHILNSIDNLSPEQIQQLRRELESKTAVSRAASQPKRTKPAKTRVEDAEDAALRQMLADGLITQLPNRDADFDDDDDEPVVIEGEPLSETIIRERR